jgi:predicted DCC family thiol-disulfide oxidoreductase YuxK
MRIRPFRAPAFARRAGAAGSGRVEAQGGCRSAGGGSQWTVFYDGECGLCTWLLACILRWDRKARLHPVALACEQAGEMLADLTPQERIASWHLVSPTGRRCSAGAALAPTLRLLPLGWAPAAVLARCPRLTDSGYRWVAGHRAQLGRLLAPSAKRRAAARVSARETAENVARTTTVSEARDRVAPEDAPEEAIKPSRPEEGRCQGFW